MARAGGCREACPRLDIEAPRRIAESHCPTYIHTYIHAGPVQVFVAGAVQTQNKPRLCQRDDELFELKEYLMTETIK